MAINGDPVEFVKMMINKEGSLKGLIQGKERLLRAIRKANEEIIKVLVMNGATVCNNIITYCFIIKSLFQVPVQDALVAIVHCTFFQQMKSNW